MNDHGQGKEVKNWVLSINSNIFRCQIYKVISLRNYEMHFITTTRFKLVKTDAAEAEICESSSEIVRPAYSNQNDIFVKGEICFSGAGQTPDTLHTTYNLHREHKMTEGALL